MPCIRHLAPALGMDENICILFGLRAQTSGQSPMFGLLNIYCSTCLLPKALLPGMSTYIGLNWMHLFHRRAHVCPLYSSQEGLYVHSHQTIAHISNLENGSGSGPTQEFITNLKHFQVVGLPFRTP